MFQKSWSNLKTRGARRVTTSKFHTEDTQILGAKEQKFIRQGDLVTGICAPLVWTMAASTMESRLRDLNFSVLSSLKIKYDSLSSDQEFLLFILAGAAKPIVIQEGLYPV
jgi:hypothetical protein